jgi:hypothetical protein
LPDDSKENDVPAAAAAEPRTWKRFSSQVEEDTLKRLKRYALENDIEIREAVHEALTAFLTKRGF